MPPPESISFSSNHGGCNVEIVLGVQKLYLFSQGVLFPEKNKLENYKREKKNVRKG
jgi:hypothetical protein